jgi:dihydrofolate synthase / folylpolyglutamate synthase
MIVTPIKTAVVNTGESLFKILDTYIPRLSEDSVIVITSKIVSLCENRVIINDETVDKRKLIHMEADQYLEDPNYFKKYHISLTIKNDLLIASAGIDESNGDGFYILWPKDPQKTTTDIWRYLRKKYQLKHLGVIITDSHTTPLRWGVTGVGLAWCGFKALKPYIGKPDLFGRPFKFVNGSIIDGLSVAAVLVMGEGNEQTPIATITDVPFVEFTENPPSTKEITDMKISISDDIYAPLLTHVPWKNGGSK